MSAKNRIKKHAKKHGMEGHVFEETHPSGREDHKCGWFLWPYRGQELYLGTSEAEALATIERNAQS